MSLTLIKGEMMIHMNTRQVQEWLTMHNIEHGIKDLKVIALNHYSIDGVWDSEWVIVPTDLKGLRDWMGY